MSATTVNSFPSLHSFTSPRSWFMAIIVLLHLGFFWALSSGLSKQIVEGVRKSEWFPVPEDIRKQPPPKPVDHRIDATVPVVTMPIPNPDIAVENEDVITGTVVEPGPNPVPDVISDSGNVVVIDPRVDSRFGLTEPAYPPAAIRQNQTGTVLLSVQVLENGRVGDVRIEQSSGHARLDEAALREARRWRFVPGTHDGVPMVMWKQVPITFRLQN